MYQTKKKTLTNWKIFNAETKFSFGKHNGRTIEQVMSNNASYIAWCIQNIDFFLIDLELLESYVDKYNHFLNVYNSESKINIDINLNPFNLSLELKDILSNKWKKYYEDQII